VECFVILGRGGPLVEEFEQVATVINISELQREQGTNNFAPHIMALLKPSRTVAIVNSCECAGILRLLASMGIPCYSLIHEFTERYNEYDVKSVLDNSRLVIFPSELVKRDAVAHHSRLNGKVRDTMVIHQGLNDPSLLNGCPEKDHAAVCEELGIPRDCTIILGVGRIQNRKGPDLFVVAAQQFIRRNPERKVAFVWIGEPDESGILLEDWVHSDIYRAGLKDKIFFLGAREDPRPYFYAADIYLHLARLDPFPCVVLEAMASGLPVILFDQVIGSTEIVRDDAGIVVPFLDMLEVHDALTTLINDPELRHTMGQRGRERIEQSFSFSRYVDTILDHVCTDRGWRQIGSYHHRTADSRTTTTQTVPVYFGASSWNISGTNVLWKHLVTGLRSLGWDARILFTDRLMIGDAYREPQVPHSRVVHAVRDNIQERWSALQNFLMQERSCIFVAGDDSAASSIIPALPSHVGVVGTLLAGAGDCFEQGYRIGLYCNRIVSVSDDITGTMCRYNPGLSDRIRTIPAHGVDRPGPLAWRSSRRPGAPLQILFAGSSTKSDDFVASCSDLLAHLDQAAFPYAVTLLADESPASLLQKLGLAQDDRVRRETVRIFSYGDPMQLTQLLEEHDTLVITPGFGALAPVLAESLSRGCLPIVVGPLCDVSPIVRSGENGIVVNDLDSAQIVKALREIYDDLPMTIRLQQTALRDRHDAYSVSDMVAQYDKVLREVAEEIADGDWTRPKPFVWSPHFGDALPPQNLIYPHEALQARRYLDF
jgi:glycosyltransferase involved in cell wall biosynthesis